MSEERVRIKKMVKWAEFVSILETTGGSLVFLFVLLLVLFGMSKWGFPSAESQIPIVVGAALGILKGSVMSKKKDDDDGNGPQIL